MTDTRNQGEAPKFLYGVTSTDRIIQTECGDGFIRACIAAHGRINHIVLTCYRAAGPLTELVLFNEQGATFTITIDSGKFTPSGFTLTDEDIRVAHKMIYLPDSTDMLILVTRMARQIGLNPVFPEDPELSNVFEFK